MSLSGRTACTGASPRSGSRPRAGSCKGRLRTARENGTIRIPGRDMFFPGRWRECVVHLRCAPAPARGRAPIRTPGGTPPGIPAGCSPDARPCKLTGTPAHFPGGSSGRTGSHTWGAHPAQTWSAGRCRSRAWSDSRGSCSRWCGGRPRGEVCRPDAQSRLSFCLCPAGRGAAASASENARWPGWPSAGRIGRSPPNPTGRCPRRRSRVRGNTVVRTGFSACCSGAYCSRENALRHSSTPPPTAARWSRPGSPDDSC